MAMLVGVPLAIMLIAGAMTFEILRRKRIASRKLRRRERAVRLENEWNAERAAAQANRRP